MFLEDWATTVQPANEAAQQYVGHSVTYGSTALQAAYIINGGALAALPAMLTSLTKANAASIATAAIPFIVGIAAAAISSLSAYLNFQWLAGLSWHDARRTAAALGVLYHRAGVMPDPKERTALSWLMNITFYLGVISALVSLFAFVWGAWEFIELARNSESKVPPVTPTHMASPVLTSPKKP